MKKLGYDPLDFEKAPTVKLAPNEKRKQAEVKDGPDDEQSKDDIDDSTDKEVQLPTPSSTQFGKRRSSSTKKVRIKALLSLVHQWLLPPCQNVPSHRILSSSTKDKAYASTIKSDNHADTWCFGPNFIMDHYTGQVCGVTGFNSKIGEKGVHIGTGLTVYDDPDTRLSQLIQVDQGLDMIDSLDHTLANPNQSRAFGVSWCDDAWDQHRPFGFSVDGRFIPFFLKDSTAVFTTRPPTPDEICDLFTNRIILTSDETWDPKHLTVPNSHPTSMPNRNSNLSAICSMKNNIDSNALRVCEPLKCDAGYIQDSGDLRLLSGISTALTDKTLLQRLVTNIHVAKTVSAN